MFFQKPNIDDNSVFITPKEPDPAEQSGQMEIFNSTVQGNRATYEVQSGFNNLGTVYDDHIKRVKEITGQDLSNPAFDDIATMDFDTRRQINDEMTKHRQEGGTMSTSAFVRQWREKQFRTQLEDLAVKYPDRKADLIPEQSFESMALARAAQAEQNQQNVWDKSAKGPLEYGSWLAGELYSGFTDPVNLTLSLVGGGPAAPGVKGLIGAGIRTGAANAAAEAAMQPTIQDYRNQAGLPSGFAEAAAAVAAAGGIGFGLDVGVRGTFRGIQAFRGYEPVVQDGVVVAYRKAGEAAPAPNLAPSEPLPAPVEIPPDLMARARDGDEMAQREVAKLLTGDDAVIPNAVVERATQGDMGAIRQVLETEAAADPVLRQMLDGAEADSRLAVKPLDTIPDAEHARVTVQTMRAVNDPDMEPLPVRMDAEPLPKPRIPQLQQEVADLRAKLDGAPDRADMEARIGELEGQIKAIEKIGRNPVADALMIRENPAFLTRDIDPEFAGARQAVALSKLSDEAFGMVTRGEAAPELGALVSDYIADPDMQSRALSDLNRMKPASPDDGRRMVAELLRSPEYQRPIEDIPGPVSEAAASPRLLDDPAGPDAKKQVQALEQKMKEELAAIGQPPAAMLQATPEARTEAMSRAALVDQAIAELSPVAPPSSRIRRFDTLDDLPPTLRAEVRAANAKAFEQALADFNAARSLDDRLDARERLDAAARQEGIEGIADGGTIWIASYAMNPKGRIAHEAVHALRTMGHLSPEEAKMLADAARQSGLFPAEREALYRSAYAGRRGVDDLIDEEAAAHFIEAVARGDLPADLPPMSRELSIVERLQELFKKIRAALTLQGYQMRSSVDKPNPATDVVQAILSGEVAKREAKAEWARANPEIVQAVRALEGMRRQQAREFLDSEDFIAAAVNRSAPGQAPTRGRVITPDGTEAYPVAYEIVDIANLKEAKGLYQPRDRASRAASDAQIESIAANLNPELLLFSPQSDRGAIVVDEAGVVLSGNGRLRALEVAKRKHPERYKAYVDMLAREGFKTDGVNAPVFVRRLSGLSADQKRNFVVKSNKDDKLAMSPSEQARVDADLVTDDALMLLDPEGEAGIGGAANRKFVRAIMDKIAPAERAAFQGEMGELTPAGANRLEAAVFARAYGDRSLTNKIVEDQDGAGLRNALLGAAPSWAQMRAVVDKEFDVTRDLVSAVQHVASMREKRIKPDQYFGQQDAFSPIPKRIENLARLFYNEDGTRAASWRSTRDALKDYARIAMDQRNAVGDLLGNKVTPDEVIDGLFRSRDAEPQALFAFAGENARTADKKLLARAKEMEGEGKDRTEIWNATGWFKGVDGKWRFEINDRDAKWRSDLQLLGPDVGSALSRFMEEMGVNASVAELFNNPEVRKAYPGIDRLEVLPMPSRMRGEGAFEGATIWLSTLADDARLRSILLHEKQHAIQNVEGFSRGGNAGMFSKDQVGRESQRLASLPQGTFDGIDGWTSVDTLPGEIPDRMVRDMLYARLAGEVEARTVEKRANMTPEERKARPPWMDYDIPESEHILRFGDDRPLYAFSEKNIRQSMQKQMAEGVTLPGGAKINGVRLFAFSGGKSGIRAFHGTPHTFDPEPSAPFGRFRLDRIGTGEGAQAYGHGLYFAESEDVARSYRDQLGDYSNSWRWSGGREPTAEEAAMVDRLKQPNANTGAPMDLEALDLNYYKTILNAERMKTSEYTPPEALAGLDENIAKAKRAREVIQGMKGNVAFDQPGRMYEVNIRANPEDFLDWDKPLSQQSEHVRAMLSGIFDDADTGERIARLSMSDARDAAIMRGDDANTSLPASQARASNQLREMGIPGIKYLDAMSRNAGDGTSNYVVFDDSLIEIVARDGEPLYAFADRSTGRSMRDDLDKLGYYSGALRAAKSLRQEKGTPEQMLAMLKKEGAKEAELQSIRIQQFLEGKTSVTKDEIVQFVDGNRVGLNEVVRSRKEHPMVAFERSMQAKYGESFVYKMTAAENAEYERVVALPSPTDIQWSSYSLDPSNPTYRETVLNLPPKMKPADIEIKPKQIGERTYYDATVRARTQSGSAMSATFDTEAEARAWAEKKAPQVGESYAEETFRSGHFSEPNIIGHMMTSMVRHEGRPTYLIDQIQSDWGQKIRDGGVRDEAKIAELEKQLAEAGGYERIVSGHNEMLLYLEQRYGSASRDRIDDPEDLRLLDAANKALGEVRRLQAELDGAKRSASGNPLVNTTDQWTTTTLRRAIRQAVEADAEYIAIPHGDTVLSYNPGDTDGMRGFYGSRTMEGIVPKNLRKLLSKIDKDAPPPMRVQELETSQGLQGHNGSRLRAAMNPDQFEPGQTGFTVFHLTDKIKQSVIAEGQPLFAFAGNREPFDRDFTAKPSKAAGLHVSAKAGSTGYAYTADGQAMILTADPQRLIRWDRYEQTPEVQRALNVVAAEHGLTMDRPMTGSEVYGKLSRKLGADQASEVLRMAGIDGHRISTGAHDNTVLYDPSLIEFDPTSPTVGREPALDMAASLAQAMQQAYDEIASGADAGEVFSRAVAPYLDQGPVNVGKARRVADMDPETWKQTKQSLKSSQPFATVDDLITKAEIRHNELTEFGQRIAAEIGGAYRAAPFKRRERIEEKLRGRAPTEITDAARGGFDVRTPDEADAIVAALAERYEVIDEGWAVVESGYFDRKVMVRFDDGVVGEIQMWPPGMFAAKKNGGQDLYTEARRPDTPPEKKAELNQKQLDLYLPVVASLPMEYQVLALRSASPALMSALGYRLASSLRDTAGASRSGARSIGDALPTFQAPVASMMADLSPNTMAGVDPSQSKYPNAMGSPFDRNIEDSQANGEAISQNAAPLFAMADSRTGRMKRRAQARAENLKQDMAELEADLASMPRGPGDADNARLVIQRKRATLLNAVGEEVGLDDVFAYKTPRGQEDPAMGFLLMHEATGREGGAADVRTLREVIQAKALGMMGEVAWAMRKGALLGDLRRTKNPQVKALMDDIIREAAGEKTGNAMAAKLGKAWLDAAEWLRQTFNAAGGDIGKLDGWFAPQWHDPEALLKAGRDQWVGYMMKDGVLDRARMLRDGQPMTDADLREMLRDVWLTITTDGANKADVSGHNGKGALYKRHAEHRVLHYKNADAYLAYAKEYGSADPYAMMINHVSMMSRDIASLKRFGANPELVRERLKQHILSDAAQSRSARSMFDDLSDMIADLKKQMGGIATPVDKAMAKIADLHSRLDEIRGKPRYKAERDEIYAKLYKANEDLTNAMRSDGPMAPEQADLVSRIMALTDEMDEVSRNYSVVTRDPNERARRIIGRADEMWKLYNGATNTPLDGRMASFMSGTRNWISASTLVMAPISAISDQATGMAARSFIGMPVTKQLMAFVRGFSKEDRQFALRAQIGLDQAMHAYAVQSRFAGMINARHVTGYIADRTHAFSGLSPMTQAAKVGFASDFMSWMADLVQTKAFGDLDPWIRQMMDRHRFSEADFNALKRVTPEMHRGVPVLTRPAIEKGAGEDVAERYMIMMLRERSMAVLEPTLRGRTAFISETKPGTIIGEMTRSIAMLKSFPTSYMMLILGRFHDQYLSGRILAGNTVAAAAGIFLVGTMLGAMAMQLKALAKGQDPQKMDDPWFWGKAFMQAGGLGIFGDFIGSSVNRQNGGLATTIMGPVADRVTNVLNLTVGNFVQYAKDEKTNFGRELSNFARQNTPGAFVPFYVRMAYERAILDELQRMVDPDAHKVFRRRMQNQKKLGGNEFYWKPGSPVPERAPNLGNAFGPQ